MASVVSDFPSTGAGPSRIRERAEKLWRTPSFKWWALIFSAYLITRLALFWRFPVFWDEGFYAVQAQTGLDFPATRFSELADGKGPLFHWISIAFVNAGISPLQAIRLISLLAGLSTMATTALIARRLSRAAALVSGALYVLLPYLLVHDVHGLVDPLLSALLSAALLLQIQQAEHARVDRALALGLILGAAWLTRDLGLYAFALLPLSLLCFDLSTPQRRERLLRWVGCSVLSFALAWLCHAVLYLSPLYYQLTELHQTTGLALQSRSFSSVLSDPFQYVSVVWPDIRDTLTGYVGIPLLVVALGAIVVSVHRRRRLAWLLAAWATTPFVGTALFTQFGYARYTLSGIPALLVLCAFGLVELWRWLRQRFGVALAAPVIALIMVLPSMLDIAVLASPGRATFPGQDEFQYASGWPSGTGLDVIGNALNRLAGPGQNVVASVAYTPWNLAVRFDHPLRVPEGSEIPFRDGAKATSRGRVLFFLTEGAPGTFNAKFLLTQSVFGIPQGVDLSRYRLVARYTKPHGDPIHGIAQPILSYLLYERTQ